MDQTWQIAVYWALGFAAAGAVLGAMTKTQPILLGVAAGVTGLIVGLVAQLGLWWLTVACIVGALLGLARNINASAEKRKLQERAARQRASLRQCPFCRSGIDREAIVCPYCRRESPAESRFARL
jgi:hypothetical protein